MKSSESKKETPIEWKDPLEAYKYVCDGAKVQCMFCASPGTLKATSTKIKLQDKPFATAGDKDGKVNFNFQGPCMHPSQQKPNAPPPPCKSIISLGQWMNVSKTFIGNERALVAGSTIVCSISGAPIRIIHSGQKATLENLFKMDSPAMGMTPKEKMKPEIIEIYWTYGKDKIRIEDFSRFYVDINLHIKTKGYAEGENLSIIIKKEDDSPISMENPFISVSGRVDRQGEITLLNVLSNYTLNLD